MSENNLLYGAIGIGLTIAGAGILYVIDFEARIRLLEARINLLSGIETTIPTSENEPKDQESAEENASASPFSKPTQMQQAISEGCAKLITQYTSTISQSDYIGISEQGKLDALHKQIVTLGCSQDK